ncbi:MAG: hypothetical protein P1U64_13160 [Alcanivoracaceae bacterium]|nr:hypothetical protein [Alcanivoracaceae bacterium]
MDSPDPYNTPKNGISESALREIVPSRLTVSGMLMAVARQLLFAGSYFILWHEAVLAISAALPTEWFSGISWSQIGLLSQIEQLIIPLILTGVSFIAYRPSVTMQWLLGAPVLLAYYFSFLWWTV